MKGADGVSGKDGTNGQNGAQGIAGQNGSDGQGGVTGQDGTNGVSGAPGFHDHWTDPDTGSSWVFVGSATYTGIACPAGYTIPGQASGPSTVGVPAKLYTYFSEFIATLPSATRFWAAIGGAPVNYQYAATINGNNFTAQVLATSQNLVLCHD